MRGFDLNDTFLTTNGEPIKLKDITLGTPLLTPNGTTTVVVDIGTNVGDIYRIDQSFGDPYHVAPVDYDINYNGRDTHHFHSLVREGTHTLQPVFSLVTFEKGLMSVTQELRGAYVQIQYPDNNTTIEDAQEEATSFMYSILNDDIPNKIQRGTTDIRVEFLTQIIKGIGVYRDNCVQINAPMGKLRSLIHLIKSVGMSGTYVAVPSTNVNYVQIHRNMTKYPTVRCSPRFVKKSDYIWFITNSNTGFVLLEDYTVVRDSRTL